MLKRLTLLYLLMSPLLSQSPDSLLAKTFPLTSTLLHHTPSPFFKGRPYYLELFVDIPEDSLQEVSIFLKTENFAQYREIAMERYRGRYRFKYEPQSYPGDSLTFFFTATTKNFSIYAVPLNEKGEIAPKEIRPIDPLEYFRPLRY